MSNFEALRDFRERWRHLADPKLREIERFVVPARVSVASSRFRIEDDTAVTIRCYAGPDDGSISLEETDILNVNFIHLDFSPEYQEYGFDENLGSLTVVGESSKMGGDYTVLILPSDKNVAPNQ